ncbi:MAG: pyridoxamine 5'-phosphate oxidase family protein [Desulfovibrio sp.]|nr:pyridoxamine 5'-phosphate oxidase family protein [Desulfovibrio sp.]
MRRQDRAISREECLALLAGCEYGLLATIDKSGWPYAVPLSYVFMDGAVYFHCAFTGHKSNNIVADNRVCFTVVGATLPVYDKNYSTYYESVIVFGRAFAVKDEQERTRGLRMLAEKYLPAHMDGFEESRRRSGGRTAVYKIVPDQITGKAKRPREKT